MSSQREKEIRREIFELECAKRAIIKQLRILNWDLKEEIGSQNIEKPKTLSKRRGK